MAREAKGTLVQGKLSINATGSATLLASVSATMYWRLKNMFVCWTAISAPGSGGSTIEFYEIDATNSSVLFTIYPSATYGYTRLDFGDEGFACSATGSRFMLNTNSGGTVGGLFTGYKSTNNT